MEFKKVFVAGCGTMGSDIAQVCAQAGISVVIYDLSREMLEKGLEKIRWSVAKIIKGQKTKESLDTVMNRITTSTSLETSTGSDMIIEAVLKEST